MRSSSVLGRDFVGNKNVMILFEIQIIQSVFNNGVEPLKVCIIRALS